MSGVRGHPSNLQGEESPYQKRRDDLAPTAERNQGANEIGAKESGAKESGANVLKVASYNIHLGIGRDGQFRPERIATVIREMDADVVALQEVRLGGPGFNILDYLGRTCCLTAIAGPTLVTSAGAYGNAILTRIIHDDVRRWNLTVGRHEPRGALDTRLRYQGKTFRVIATHLGLLPAERRRQVRALLKMVESAGTVPTVLLGDVNEWFLWGRPLRWMHRHFGRTPAPATYPAGRPVFALDRIWVEPQCALKHIGVHASETARMASDHLPLVAKLDFGTAAGQLLQADGKVPAHAAC